MPSLWVLGVSVVQLHSSLRLCFLAPLRFGSAFAFSAASSRPSAESARTICTRWIRASQPLHWCHFSGLSRTSRHTKMSIQRFLGGFPPLISAAIVQFVHFANQKEGCMPSKFEPYCLGIDSLPRLRGRVGVGVSPHPFNFPPRTHSNGSNPPAHAAWR
jgi:hypothetical protein